MTFVKVKDHEWVDLNRGTALNVLKLVEGGRIDIETISGPLKFTYYFPTLAEALTAAEKIIGSCDGQLCWLCGERVAEHEIKDKP